MAPLPVNSTATLFVDYQTCGEGHTLQIRFGVGGSAGDAMTVADALLTALSGELRLITIQGARVRDLGGSVTYPVTWTGAATYGSGAGLHFETAYYMDFVGRSLDGRKCRVSVFGHAAPADLTGDDFRMFASDSSAVANALTALEADPNTPVSISGDTVNWHQYADIGTNAYWRNRIR